LGSEGLVEKAEPAFAQFLHGLLGLPLGIGNDKPDNLAIFKCSSSLERRALHVWWHTVLRTTPIAPAGFLLAVSLAACGGGGSHGASLPQAAPTPASTAAPYTGPLADARFTITIPGLKSTGATARRPAYISSSTASVTITLNSPPSGFTQPGTFALTPGTTNGTSNVACPAFGSGYGCTIPIRIPPGSDSLTVTTRDAVNSVLSQQTATFTITAGQNNTPSMTLDANTGSIAVTPSGAGVLVWGIGCSGSTISGAGNLSNCTANFGNSIAAKNFTVNVTDFHGMTIPSNDPGAPALTASSSDTSKFGTSFLGNTLAITPLLGGTATITLTATPANSSGTSPGDGLSPVMLTFTVTQNHTGTVTEFSTGISFNSGPFGITNGPDGNLWFAEYNTDLIGRITPNGTVTEFSAGITALSAPQRITSGPDGNVWFTEYHGGIGRVTPSGAATEFSAAALANSQPFGITTGPDGNLWFTEFSTTANRIGRITPAGSITEFSAGITASSQPQEITSGPDGNLWFSESSGNRIGRITPSGTVTEFSAGITAGSTPTGITSGPDGNLWFTEYNGNRIGRITPAGTVTEFSAGITAASHPQEITSGPDGNLWFTENSGNRIGRITPSGTVTEFPAGTLANCHPFGITSGVDGNLWFTESNSNTVGRIAP
jgi:streptogramin lyase